MGFQKKAMVTFLLVHKSSKHIFTRKNLRNEAVRKVLFIKGDLQIARTTEPKKLIFNRINFEK